jgi:hypothetical protein
MDQVLSTIKTLRREIDQLKQRRVYRRDVAFGEIKQVHVDGIIIFRGLVVDRPTNGNTEIQAYFATDENKLYIWNDVSLAWKSVALS